MNADSKRAPDTYLPIIGATMEVYRIALGESTWGLRGSNTKDWSIQRTICANLRHLRLTFSRKEKSNELYTKPSTAKEPKSERFSGISTWAHTSPLKGQK